MKKMMLATLALVMLFGVVSTPAFAASTLYDFTLRNTSGTAFCDGMVLYLYKGTEFGTGSKTLVDGYHWLTDCSSTSSAVNGFKAAIAPQYQYGGIGANLIVSDPEFGNGALGGQGQVWLFNPAYGTWTGYFSGGGSGEYVFNYGTWVNFTHADKKGTKAASKR